MIGLPGRHRNRTGPALGAESRDVVAVSSEASDVASRARRRPVPLQASRQRRSRLRPLAANAPGQGAVIALGVASSGGSRSASHLPAALRPSESVAVRDPVQSSLRTGVRLGPTSLGH